MSFEVSLTGSHNTSDLI